MNIQQKYKSLPIKQRAAIMTASIILGTIAFFTILVTLGWLIFPLIFIGLLGMLIYAMYRAILSGMEINERYKK